MAKPVPARQDSGGSTGDVEDSRDVKSASGSVSEELNATQVSFASARRTSGEHIAHHRSKPVDDRKQWSAIKSLMKKLNTLSEPMGDAGWGPAYEIASKPTRKGPTMGLFFAPAKRPEYCSLIMQTPDSMERYSFYGKLMQHMSCAPYAITTVTYGHVVGIGRCGLCGTQCGKVVVYKLDTFERIFVFDTLYYYGKAELPMVQLESIPADEDSVVAPNAFEINALKLVKTFENYSTMMVVGNQLGHLLVVELPSMRLLNIIYYPKQGVAATPEPPTSAAVEEEEEDDNEYEETPRQQRIQTVVEMGDPSPYISCLKVQPNVNDVWVGYGDGTFAVFTIPAGLCKKHVPADSMEKETNSNVEIDVRWQRVTSIHFSGMLDLALVVYGNIRVDVWDSRTYTLLKSLPASILTCDSSLISSMRVYEGHEKMCLLFIGSMEGSLIMRKVQRHPTHGVSWSLLLNLLYDIKFSATPGEKHESTHELESIDFRGAPITCIYPLLSYNAVIVGNACGAMVAAWNVLKRIRGK
ncbi:hypothetical protein, conserved [Babesia bigemina]|uniref:CNH domain-containing protein n=1 Tax=Babesia bigemina TaxID=5866 RepID=A0A061D2B1_BABBI|nr:hypothetical protein, conserved [Babesia bigemina]CDR94743.1 hypothetical protein, conserved [Babesia bigemina]|eukprot:XP_012766929.1 hypothetical protein, conserved [Babesia bigemina]